MEASPALLVERLQVEPDASVKQALILALGQYGDSSQIDEQSLRERFLKMYRSDPNPGIHAATEWALRNRGLASEVARIDEPINGTVDATSDETADWFLTKHGHTMVVIPGPSEFVMGSEYTQRGRTATEFLHRKRIARRFLMASKEVTVKQFHDFLEEVPSVTHRYTGQHAPEDECPQISITWYEAAAYCRWLSEKEDVDKDQMCFPPIDQIKEGMTLPPNYL